MVSIGKLAAGQAKYYLDQAGGAVSRSSAVSTGVEDYYVRGHEPVGRWLGRSASAIGLVGEVAPADLEKVLAGQHSATGETLRTRGRVPGFDVTFSAPKSVSVLFGVGDDVASSAVRSAHESAVAQAFAHLERHVAFGRRGAGGADRVVGTGLIGAAFVHRTSRAGDPHLHTHALVANLVLGRDGRWSALDGRLLYAHAKTASYLYQAALRAELSRELGVSWEPVSKGIAEIYGVPDRVRRGFSRRRAEIEAELARAGTQGARAAQAATLQTRRAKRYGVRPERLREEWRQRARLLGLGDGAVRRLQHRPARERRARVTEAEVLGALSQSDGLTAARSSFDRRDVVRALCERLPIGTTTQAIEAAADRYLAGPLVVPLLDAGARGRHADERRYSTPELLALERAMIERAVALRGAGRGVVARNDLERALRDDAALSAEQRLMVTRLVLDGDGVAVVIGQAGTGKTRALAAARQAWDDVAVPVAGCAVSRRAAHELEAGSGIPSTSLAALLRAVEKPRARLPDGCVVVVDEAAMAPTRELGRLVAQVDSAGGKLVLVGDPEQLPSIRAGGMLGGLATRLEPIVLQDNLRQRATWERDALQHLRCGEPARALAAYAAHDRLTVAADREQGLRRLVEDWHAAADPDSTLMIAHYRSDVAELNARARVLMQASGGLGSCELAIGDRSFAVGDRVVIRRNDRRVGVRNGERGAVTGVDLDAGALTVRLAGVDVRIPPEFLTRRTPGGDPSLQHAYAITAYVAQGLTCRTALVLAHDDVYRQWAYTALSRGTDRNQLYVVAERPDPRAEYAPSRQRDPGERLQSDLRRSRAQVLAADGAQALVDEALALEWRQRAVERRRAADRDFGRDL